MEGIKTTLSNLLTKFKKIILLVLVGISGLLLTLSGFGLIQLTQTLILYSGIVLLVMTVLIYFFM